jgi:lysophospholipase L1-like esterase/tetratricopeptide (TPR) repeat protein
VHRLARRLLLAAASGLVAVLLVEVALRMTGGPGPDDAIGVRLPGVADDGEPYRRHDELLLFSLVPHTRAFAGYEIDAHGYRTPEFADAKPVGCLRVVTLGDSTTFGLSVVEGQQWPAVLRRALEGLCQGAVEVEVVNAAVSGYSTWQNRMQIERDLLPLRPDLVVWMVTGVNDNFRVEGPDDAEQSSRQSSVLGRLGRLRVARLLGLGRYGWRGVSPNAEDGSTTARLRVSPAQAEDNLRAVDGRLPARLAVGLFPPAPQFRTAADCSQLLGRLAAVASERGLPLADLRPTLAALASFPLYLDAVHPNPLGHVLIARAVLDAVVDRLELPPARAAWVLAWRRALAGGLPEQAATLTGPGAPRRFLELVDLCGDATLDARLEHGDAALPEAVREWDPLLGRRCRELGVARLLEGGADDDARRAEIERFVVPRDPLLACFADDASYLAAHGSVRALGRALVIFTAEIGLPPLRADVRRGQAVLAGDPRQAADALAEVLALAPSDDRQPGAAREQWAALAHSEGALADFARGMLAYQDGRLDEAEPLLRRALEARPWLWHAHSLLGQICLASDRQEEASREFALANGLGRG